MSDETKSNPPLANKQPEYSKPEVEVLGDLRELTEGAVDPTTDIGSVGSQG